MHDLDPLLVPFDVRSMESLVSTSLQPARFSTTLITVCGAVALLLAMIGVYGVVSYGVAQRRPEFGVRMALGANRRDVVSLVVRRELWPVATGLVLGIGLAYGVAQMLTVYLFGVSPTDPGSSRPSSGCSPPRRPEQRSSRPFARPRWIRCRCSATDS